MHVYSLGAGVDNKYFQAFITIIISLKFKKKLLLTLIL